MPLTVGEIGPNRSMLPDGSMLCRNVPIARTGWLQYAPGEVPLDAPKQKGSSPIIYVHRGPEDLFRPETMQSFVGVAICNEHPPVPVTPKNFAHLGKGFILNTYRGEGEDSDCLMADLIVKDKWLMQDIDANKREVSAGYEASYEQTGDGEGRQFDIIGNHLALVARGRCGPRCAIGDEDTSLSSTTVNEETDMTTPTTGAKKRVPLAELRARVADTLGMLDQAEEETQGVHVHVHMPGSAEPKEEPTASGAPPKKEGAADDKAKVTTLDAAAEARFKAIEEGQEELKGTLATILEAVKAGAAQKQEPKEEDLETVTEATATMDSAALATSYQALLADAEVLVPGFKVPTFDAAAKRHATVDRMCTIRRSVLSAAAVSALPLVTAANGGKEFDVVGASCPDVATVFKAAAAAKKAENNRKSTGDSGTLPSQTITPPVKRVSFADVNEANKKFWASQGPRA